VNLSSVRASVTDSAFGVCLALCAASCITPPGAKPARGAGATPGAPPTAVLGKPREFKHTAAEILASAGIGWNVGNSLDVPEGETAWGNPKVSQELIDAVAHAGFGLVRIPITWSKHMGPAPDFAIEPSWFERVDQVVGYARNAGLYAVINVHHDGADGLKGVQWLALKDANGETTAANNSQVRARFIAVWTQIAKHFANAGEELLFESMNEVHDGYGKPDPRHYVFINELNQQFVNLVRASSGNNPKRS
jgi:endoglucanase